MQDTARTQFPGVPGPPELFTDGSTHLLGSQTSQYGVQVCQGVENP